MSSSQEKLDGLTGRPVPKRDEDKPLLRAGTSSARSFQEFEGSTMDAWDDCPDEIMTSTSSGSYSCSPKTVQGKKYKPDLENGNVLTQSCEDFQTKTEINCNDSEENKTIISSSKLGARSTLVNMDTVKKLSEELVKSEKNVKESSKSVPIVDEEASFVIRPTMSPSPQRDRIYLRIEKFGKLLAGPTTDLEQLRKYSWNGIPKEVRPKTWRLLSGYMPPAIGRRKDTIKRKRLEYQNFVEQYYPTRVESFHERTFKQICKDVPRMHLAAICEQVIVQDIFKRILFIWAIRHPASGYVQGINDFVVPLFVVFLGEYVDQDPVTLNINDVPKQVLDYVEADTFWCVSKLLDGIQDNYTFNQPGIQIRINELKNLISRINAPLNIHLENLNIDYLQFAFRWMNNLLTIELPLMASIRLWDTYWAEPDGFSIFHLYVCAALLKRFAVEIQTKSTDETALGFLLRLPCKNWSADDIGCLVSEAYQLRFMFADAPQHLKDNYLGRTL